MGNSQDFFGTVSAQNPSKNYSKNNHSLFADRIAVDEAGKTQKSGYFLKKYKKVD